MSSKNPLADVGLSISCYGAAAPACNIEINRFVRIFEKPPFVCPPHALWRAVFLRMAPPQFIGVAHSKPPADAERTPLVRHHHVRQTTPLLPKRSRLTALHRPVMETRTAAERARTLPVRLGSRYRNGLKPVAPFVVVSCPAPPVNTRTDRHCLAADTAGPKARFLLRAHSQTHPFEAPGRQARHRLPHRQDEPFPGYSRSSHNRSRRLTCCRMSQAPARA